MFFYKTTSKLLANNIKIKRFLIILINGKQSNRTKCSYISTQLYFNTPVNTYHKINPRRILVKCINWRGFVFQFQTQYLSDTSAF